MRFGLNFRSHEHFFVFCVYFAALKADPDHLDIDTIYCRAALRFSPCVDHSHLMKQVVQMAKLEC